MAKIIEKYIKKYILHILFIICCYLTIRWSDLPVINIKIFEKIFVHTKEVDAAVLNVVTGYITGYIVYLITVFLPTIKRNKPVKKIVMERITIINQEAIYLLLLIYKNCCTEIEWEQVYAQQKKDTACLNDLFFERMKKFDVTADADTILLHSENRTPLKWYEYLEYRYDKIYQELDELFLHYHMYLDDETIDIITEIKDCRFFDMFLGKGHSFLTLLHAQKDKIGYYESMPIGKIYEQNSLMTPVFQDNNGVENNRILKEYVSILKKVQEFSKIYKQKSNLDVFDEEYAISKLQKKDIGHCCNQRAQTDGFAEQNGRDAERADLTCRY